MMTMAVIVWLFPTLFMIHEMEEIVLVKPWKESVLKNGKAHEKMPYRDFVSTEAFSLAVSEELLIIAGVTMYAWLTESYYSWLGLFIAFMIHYVGHIVMSIKFKGFVPGVATAVIQLVLCSFIVKYVVEVQNMGALSVVIWTVIMFAVLMGNLKILHKLMPWFESKLDAFSN